MYQTTLSSDTNTRTFLFDIASIQQKGWAFLRLVQMIDESDGIQTTLHYNPEIHDGSSHYMGDLWRARKTKIHGQDTFTLIGAFGNPGEKIVLEVV